MKVQKKQAGQQNQTNVINLGERFNILFFSESAHIQTHIHREKNLSASRASDHPF